MLGLAVLLVYMARTVLLGVWCEESLMVVLSSLQRLKTEVCIPEGHE